MTKLFYLKPNLDLESQALDYAQEFQEYGSHLNGAGGLNKYLKDYSGWLVMLDKARHRITTEKEVPSETFFLVREHDNRIVGMSNIRLSLNENQRKHGGHVGFSIRPTERRKGYNKVNLYLALTVLQSHGIKEALLDCRSDNVGSYKTIESLGGKMTREYFDDEEDFCNVKSYVIDVDNAIGSYREIYEPKIAKLPNYLD